MQRRRFAVAGVLLCAAVAARRVSAQGEVPIRVAASDPAELPGALPPDPAEFAPATHAEKERLKEFLATPIPISNPTLGSGLGAVVALVFPLSRGDRVSPPTVAGIGGFYTSRESYSLGLGIRTYLDEDRWRFLLGGGGGKIHYEYFGVGRENDLDKSIPVVQEFSGFLLEGLRRVAKGFFLGPRYVFAHSNLSAERERPETPIEIPEGDRSVQNAAVGLHAQFDSRNSTFFPLRGTLFDVNADFYEKAFGSDRDFQSYRAAYNTYLPLADRQVLALRASACSVRGDVPVYSLCIFGAHGDLRGYEAGRYLDRAMYAVQAEWRFALPERMGFLGRFGFVAFAGVGEVAPSFSDFDSATRLPSGGAGLRYLVARENHINLRIDCAWGKGDRGVYVGVGEAF